MGEKKNAFVIMPFDAELNEVYGSFLVPVLELVGYVVTRADDLYDQQNILRSIVGSIASADLVVADLTGLNANVFYELGVAHALGRPTILLTQSVEELPFDLRSYRVIPYSTHFARIDKAREDLRATAQGALDGTLEFGSPVTDFGAVPFPKDPRATPQVSRAEAADEPGWLDHVVALEEGYEKLSKVLDIIAAHTSSIGEDTRTHTLKLERARATAGSQANAALRLLASEYSRRLAQYGEQLAVANREYEDVAASTQDSIEFIISHGNVNSKEDMQSLTEYVATLAGVTQSAAASRQSFVEMRQNTRGIEGIERSLTRSSRVVGEELDRLIANIDRTIASMQRGIEVGQARLAAIDPGSLEDTDTTQHGPDA